MKLIFRMRSDHRAIKGKIETNPTNDRMKLINGDRERNKK